ncbi:MAG: DUF4878 domain-containing protein [Bacteroidales bacterium]|nr:DUF4878 domain-containing protein [Bacteroidales bacterium]
MKKFVGFALFVLVLLLMFTSCAEMTPGEASVKYYNYLKDGKYEKLVDVMYQEDGITPDERIQLVALAKKFGEETIRDNKGIKKVILLKETIEEDGLSASVVCEITFGDGTMSQERDDMVKRDKVWLIKDK